MADDREQDKGAPAPRDAPKNVEPVSGDKKTDEAVAGAGSSALPKENPGRHLPTHFRGMPKQWEKNQEPEKGVKWQTKTKIDTLSDLETP
ncbi:hypothetical protein AAE478_010436 [Parahypoxylon ruwenzoriense]